MLATGAFWFGVVIGFVTYRTLRHSDVANVSDIAAVIAAVGGAAVVALFPAGTPQFDNYAIGLTVGFFGYLILSLVISVIAKDRKADKEFLGDSQ